LVLVISSLVVFKAGPNLAELLTGYRSNQLEQLDMLFKLVTVASVGAVVVGIKWWITGSVAWSLFAVLFTVGVCVAVSRFLLAVGVWASYRRFSADPVVLLVQVVIGTVLVITAPRTSKISTTIIDSHNAFFALLVLFMFMFRPMFAFHELLDHHGRVSQTTHGLTGLKDHKPSQGMGDTRSLVTRLLLVGSAPVIVLQILEIISLSPIFPVISGLVIGACGILSARRFAEYWALIESVRTRSDSFAVSTVVDNFSILIVPYVTIFLVALARGTCIWFSVNVQTDTEGPTERFVREFLPDRAFMDWFTSTCLSLTLLVHAVQAVTTVAYKRLVKVIKG
jgi:hypothetical protein